MKAAANATLKQAGIDLGPRWRKSAVSGNGSPPGHATEDGGDDDAALTLGGAPDPTDARVVAALRRATVTNVLATIVATAEAPTAERPATYLRPVPGASLHASRAEASVTAEVTRSRLTAAEVERDEARAAADPSPRRGGPVIERSTWSSTSSPVPPCQAM
ncbi:MAG: hypothetical protein A2V77_13160 [Anaeromyxobacter sp. RBG_16_69_14]|nr:MAG: hypothetical protein A2V77_13160 [Anaeromyxobacter sp. RBG_16_69_14]